jgi:hypothetical protein
MSLHCVTHILGHGKTLKKIIIVQTASSKLVAHRIIEFSSNSFGFFLAFFFQHLLINNFIIIYVMKRDF